MKLKDILKNLDKSTSNSDWVDLDKLYEEFGICEYGVQDTDKRLTCYWIANHICTDTWVGYRAYFFDDELFACSHQQCRKSSEDFYWVESMQKPVKDYLESLREESEDDPRLFVDLEEDFPEQYSVRFTSELLSPEVVFQGKLYGVDRKWKDPDDTFGISQKVKLKGIVNPVSIELVGVPYNTVK